MEAKWIIFAIFFVIIILGILLSINSLSRIFPSTSVIFQGPNLNIPVTAGQTPTFPLTLPSGFTIHVFASGLGSPRVLTFSPGGTLLVSDPNNNTVTALPDPNHEGKASTQKVVINSGNHVHGLAFYNGQLFVAEETRVVRYAWDESTLTAKLDKVLFSLPNNNDHNLRTITFDKNGNMFVSVGSTCNVCIESNPLSATVIASNSNGDNPHIFASGLRNASFIAFNPQTQDLWGTEMGRDYLGDNLPPDEINIITNGNNYGWPWCYGNKVHDDNFDSGSTHPCENTAAPIYEIPAHSAPLGLAFIDSKQFPADWQGDLLVAYHGSWNRSIPTGYKVVHLKVNRNAVTGRDDFLKGFLPNIPSAEGQAVSRGALGPTQALGRPVDLIFDSQGNLYISDDKAGNIYIVQHL